MIRGDKRSQKSDQYPSFSRFESYAARRYGAWNEYAVQAWEKLRTSVYDFNGDQKIRGKYTITRHPSLKISPWVSLTVLKTGIPTFLSNFQLNCRRGTILRYFYPLGTLYSRHDTAGTPISSIDTTSSTLPDRDCSL